MPMRADYNRNVPAGGRVIADLGSGALVLFTPFDALLQKPALSGANILEQLW